MNQNWKWTSDDGNKCRFYLTESQAKKLSAEQGGKAENLSREAMEYLAVKDGTPF